MIRTADCIRNLALALAIFACLSGSAVVSGADMVNSPKSDERLECIRRLLTQHTEKFNPDKERTQLANQVEKDFVAETKCPPVPTAPAFSLVEIRKQTELAVAAATASRFPPLDEKKLQQEAAKKYPIVEMNQSITVKFQSNPVRQTTVTAPYRGMAGDTIIVGTHRILLKDLVPPPSLEIQRLQFDPEANKMKRDEYVNQRQEAIASAKKTFADTELNAQWSVELNKTRELNETAGYIWDDGDWRNARQLIHTMLENSLSELKGIHSAAVRAAESAVEQPKTPTATPLPSPATPTSPLATTPPVEPPQLSTPEPAAPAALPWGKKKPTKIGLAIATAPEDIAAVQQKLAAAAATKPGTPPAPTAGTAGTSVATTPAAATPTTPSLTVGPPPPPAPEKRTPPPAPASSVSAKEPTSSSLILIVALVAAALGAGAVYIVKIALPQRARGVFINDRVEAERDFWPLTEKNLAGFKFTAYKFTSFPDAYQCMARITYIHPRGPNEKMTSAAPITFGVYPSEQGFIAFVGGENLTYPMWREAMRAFSASEGVQPYKCSAPPETVLDMQPGLADVVSEHITFLRTACGTGANFGHLAIVSFKAPDKDAGMRFLGALKIGAPGVQVLVETPDGTIRRDSKGVYNE